VKRRFAFSAEPPQKPPRAESQAGPSLPKAGLTERDCRDTHDPSPRGSGEGHESKPAPSQGGHPPRAPPREGDPATVRKTLPKIRPEGAGTESSRRVPWAPRSVPWASQNGRGWKGPLWVIQSNPPAQAGSPSVLAPARANPRQTGPTRSLSPRPSPANTAHADAGAASRQDGALGEHRGKLTVRRQQTPCSVLRAAPLAKPGPTGWARASSPPAGRRRLFPGSAAGVINSRRFRSAAAGLGRDGSATPAPEPGQRLPGGAGGESSPRGKHRQ